MIEGFLNGFFNYLNDKLSNKERHAYEKELNSDPFLQDAMDGFALLNPDEIESDLSVLHSRLQSRIEKRKSRKLIFYFSMAASIALILGIGVLIIGKNSNRFANHEIAENQAPSYEQNQPSKNQISPTESRSILDEMAEDIENNETGSVISIKSKSSKSYKLVKSKTDFATQPQRHIDKLAYDNTKTATLNIVADDGVDLVIEDAELETANEIQPIAPQPTSSMNLTNEKLSFNIKGTIIDTDTKEPLIGASISQNTEGTVSDMDGNFSFKILDDSVLQIAYIGYKTKKISVNELLKNDNLIELQADQLALEEVVVVGYGTQKKQILTGAVSRVELNKEPPENLSYSTRTKNARLNYNSGFEKHAEPEGGIKNFGIYLQTNTTLKPHKTMKVILEFYVTASGQIEQTKIIKSDGPQITSEAIRLLNEGPTWTPAFNNDKAIGEMVNLKMIFQARE